MDRLLRAVRPLPGLAILGALAWLSLGCAGWPGVPQPDATASPSVAAKLDEGVSPTELRLRLQRFADGLSEALAGPLDQLLAGEQEVAKRKLIVEAKYAYSSNALFIASGPYPAVSLLDMVVFVNLARASIERESRLFSGVHYDELLRAARKYEGEVWQLSGFLLTKAQQDELRGLIRGWLDENRDRTYSEAVRFGEFASELGEVQGKQARGLLSQIRGVTATADQALELAERMNYFFQRAPVIWRMHGQMAYFEMVSQPEMRGLFANATSIAASTDRLSRTIADSSTAIATALTSAPSPEQEALFAQLGAGEQSLAHMLVELRETMGAATELAGAVEVLATRFDVGGPKPAKDPDAKPFDIVEYVGAAAQLATTAGDFRNMIESLNELISSPALSEGLPAATTRAQAEATSMMRSTVLLIALTVVGSFCLMLAALFLYRVYVGRLDSGHRSSS
jgi:hypothetical protein